MRAPGRGGSSCYNGARQRWGNHLRLEAAAAGSGRVYAQQKPWQLDLVGAQTGKELAVTGPLGSSLTFCLQIVLSCHCGASWLSLQENVQDISHHSLMVE